MRPLDASWNASKLALGFGSRVSRYKYLKITATTCSLLRRSFNLCALKAYSWTDFLSTK